MLLNTCVLVMASLFFTVKLGDRAWGVAALASLSGKKWPLGKRLVPGYPYIEAEVRYATRHEYAETAIDVIPSIIFMN